MAGRRRAGRVSDTRLTAARTAAESERIERQRSVRALTPRRRLDGWTGRRGGRRYRAARRALAVLLLVVAGLTAARQAEAAPGVDVVTLTADRTTGDLLTAADVRLTRVPAPPDGALQDTAAVPGRRLNSPARRGEVLTDVRLVGAAGPSPGAGRSAVAVRLRDPALTPLLQVGTPVTVVGIGADGAPRSLSTQAWVLVVLEPDGGGRTDRPVLLSVPDGDALVGATLTGDIALRLR